jgi:two-component system OmpR family sensor kinase
MIRHRPSQVAERTAPSAAQAYQSTQELIAVLAHELNRPLVPLVGYLDVLRQRAQQEGRRTDARYAEQAALAASRLHRLITELLDASRLEQGLFAPTLVPVDLAALVRQAAQVLRTSESAIAVRAPAQLAAEADPRLLAQALENLIGNALAHAPAGVPIVVQVEREARATGAWAVITVRDKGPGIPPELLPTLFERFTRGTRSTGLGLGLYLAKGIAELHGGTLTVESRLGKGTSFHLSLPLDAARAASA